MKKQPVMQAAMKILLPVLVLLLLIYTGFKIIKSKSEPLRDMKNSLSQEVANFRSRHVSDVDYQLHLTFDRNPASFSGNNVISFNLKSKVKTLTIDFSKGKISSLVINDHQVKDIVYNNFFISIDGNLLKEGRNVITIVYESPYNKTAQGLYRFADPVDKNIYIYSQSEPFEANLIYPCFDQPDLKATFTLQVTAPKNWVVVSAAPQIGEKNIDNEFKDYIFEKTLPMSTYVFPVIAGPYHVWESTAGSIPLRLLCRKTMAQYVDSNEWFTVTQKGFDFFQKYLDFPYPFKKYDQILVPDFIFGGMENTAAITHSESSINKGRVLLKNRQWRMSGILHEMAHMWFGNIVTMKWWDGLWLNESFATYFTALSKNTISDIDNAWMNFYNTNKRWAYWNDQLIVTHPINMKAKTTDDAFANADSITYGKGAAAIKQLVYLLGEDAFRKSMQLYIKKYAYTNSDIEDIMSILEKTSGKNLSKWTDVWINKAGLNEIKVEGIGKGNFVQSCLISQSAPELNPVLRPHAFKVGLYNFNAKKEIVLVKSINAYIDDAQETIALTDEVPKPLFIYPNVDDYGYFKVQLDNESITNLKKHITDIKDPMLRTMIWQNLWDMVQDVKLPWNEYVQMVIDTIDREDDITIIETIFSNLHRSGFTYFFSTHGKSHAGSYFAKSLEQIEDICWKKFIAAGPGSEMQKFWFEKYVRGIYSSKGLGNTKQILLGKVNLRNLYLDQDLRWRMIITLCSHDHPGARALREKEMARDRTSSGKIYALSAEATIPSEQIKKQLIARIMRESDTITSAEIRAITAYIFPDFQEDLIKNFQDDFFRDLRKSFTKNYIFLNLFIKMAPAIHTEGSIVKFKKFIEDNKEMPVIVSRDLKIIVQEMEKCIKIRALAEKSLVN